MRRALLALVATSLLGLAAAGPASAHHPSAVGCMDTSWMEQSFCPGKKLPALGNNALAETPFGDTDSERLELLTNTPKSDKLKNTNSDIAFQGKYLYQGNYDGFAIYDIAGAEPRLVSETVCPGSQNDISVYGDYVITSTDSTRNKGECDGNTAGSATSIDGTTNWEGLRIFDVSDPKAPELVQTVKTKCGSHTHTLVPDEKNDTLYAYVSSYSPGANTNCLPPHRLISVVKIPLADPKAASVTETPLLPLNPTTSGCHDITAYPAKGIAAGACMGEGMLFDISNPASPRKIATILDQNFSFWHSATFSNDGTKVIFTDELGGGTAARCTDAYGENQGADAIYDIAGTNRTQPKFISYFKIPRFQTTQENCVSHNGNLLPHPTRDLFVQAWYQGGTSIIDFTDATKPREVAFFDRGPVDETRLVSGGHWSSYWYNGRIYGNEIARGLDVLEYSGDVTKVKVDRLNAQTQEPFERE